MLAHQLTWPLGGVQTNKMFVLFGKSEFLSAIPAPSVKVVAAASFPFWSKRSARSVRADTARLLLPLGCSESGAGSGGSLVSGLPCAYPMPHSGFLEPQRGCFAHTLDPRAIRIIRPQMDGGRHLRCVHRPGGLWRVYCQGPSAVRGRVSKPKCGFRAGRPLAAIHSQRQRHQQYVRELDSHWRERLPEWNVHRS